MLRFLLLALLLPLSAPAHAQTRTEATFTVRISGITIGRMQLTGVESGSSYSSAALITSAGAARVFRDFSYTARSQGRLSRGRLIPVRYEEKADTGRRQSESILEYSRGIPRLTRYTSPKAAGPDSPDPSTQGGTLDPLSALYALLRDQPAAGLCNATLALFDGKRRSQIRLGAPQAVQGGIVCAGEYRRVAGFTLDELARHTTFPVKVLYAPSAGGMMQAAQVEVQSVYGPATLVRR